MANRNLADEVDALAKGLASLRVATKGLSARIARLEAPKTIVQHINVMPGASTQSSMQRPIIPQPRGFLESRERAARPSLLQRARAWIAWRS